MRSDRWFVGPAGPHWDGFDADCQVGLLNLGLVRHRGAATDKSNAL